MRDRDRLTLARNPHEQPARAQAAQAQYPARDRIESTEIEEQPAVGAELLETSGQRGAVQVVNRHSSYPSTAAARQ